jgi:hypothetical protein
MAFAAWVSTVSAALTRVDLKALIQFFQRLARGASFAEALANCNPAETAAIDSFNAGNEAAALRIKGRPLSRAEVKSVNLQRGDF